MENNKEVKEAVIKIREMSQDEKLQRLADLREKAIMDERIMFESIMKLVRKVTKKEDQTLKSKDAAKERLHLVLMQDRANVSADFLDLMKQEIIDVIKKYIEIDESAIDVKLTNKDNGDGTNGAPALYANIPILNIKDEVRQ